MKKCRWLKALPLAPVAGLSLIGLGLALGLTMIGCNPSFSTQVRFVHAIYDAPALNIEINSTTEFSNVAFAQLSPSTGYKDVAAGSDTVEGVQTNTGEEAFFVANVVLLQGTGYTMVATGNVVNTYSAVILTSPDNNNVPNDGTVSFRFINAAPDGPTAGVDIYVMPAQEALTAPATVSALKYQGTTSYLNVPYNKAGSGFVIYVCTAGTTTPLFSQAMAVGGPNEGVIRTLIMTDQQGLQALNPAFVVLNDVN